MTEEILQSAILRLKSRATERFAIIKDLYHRPATTETVELITQHAVALAQLEGAMITLQQYAPVLAKQTEAEAESNAPQEPIEVEVEEEVEQEEEKEEEQESEDKQVIGHEELMERSTTYRKSQKNRKQKSES